VRVALFYLVLVLMQGFWDALLAPLPAPDLFLLALVVLVWRVQPWHMVLIAYGLGLLQDIIGHGIFGLHALGLAAAALGSLLVWAQLRQTGIYARTFIVLGALAAKWLAITPLIIWQTGILDSALDVLRVAPLEAVFTLLLSFLILPWGIALFKPRLLLERDSS
jgi:rod shape-determining protein MreD